MIKNFFEIGTYAILMHSIQKFKPNFVKSVDKKRIIIGDKKSPVKVCIRTKFVNDNI